MSQNLPTPPVPDLARARGETVGELIDWFVNYFNTQGAPFNYRRATKIVRGAYKGLHQLHLLTAGCVAEKNKIGRMANADVVESAAPFAFGRATQVFDLPARRFSFGREYYAGYRIPFLFVEKGVIKIYYLQPRKSEGPSFDDFGMIATIMKRYLLDTEFFGQRCDLEIVDVSAPEGEKVRYPQRFTLADLNLWSDRRLSDRLTLISEALDKVKASDRVTRRPRTRPRPEPDMPLFD